MNNAVQAVRAQDLKDFLVLRERLKRAESTLKSIANGELCYNLNCPHREDCARKQARAYFKKVSA